jgi:hypothetical protein
MIYVALYAAIMFLSFVLTTVFVKLLFNEPGEYFDLILLCSFIWPITIFAGAFFVCVTILFNLVRYSFKAIFKLIIGRDVPEWKEDMPPHPWL